MARRYYVLSIRSGQTYRLTADGADLAIQGGEIDWDVVPAPSLSAGSISATPGVEQITIAEVAAPSGGVPPYSVALWRADSAEGAGSLLQASPSWPYVDETVTPDVPYWYWLRVTDDAETTVDSGRVTATADEAVDGPVWRGNEPAGMTALHDEAIGDWGTIPTSNDAPIPNSGVNIVANVNDTTYTRVGNQNPPRGAPYAVEVFIPDGMASGQGGAAVYAVIPDREVVYVCCYHKIPVDFQENSVSSKLFRFTFSGGDILVQLNRFENYFESMNFGTPLAGVVSREDIITGDWVLCEILLNREDGRISTWLDGVPVTVNASVSTGAGPSSVWFDSTWGGVTAAKNGDDVRWFSDFYISGGDA